MTDRYAYLQKYRESAAAVAGSGERAFMSFLESLTDGDWSFLLEDLVQGRAAEVVRPPLGEDVLTHAVTLLAASSISTHKRIAGVIERILRSPQADPSDQAASMCQGLVFLATNLASEAASDLLLSVMNDDTYHSSIRALAADALSQDPSNVPTTFWLTLDIVREPTFAPAVVSALATAQPETALARLNEIDAPDDLDGFEYPVRIAVRQLTVRDPLALRTAIRSASPWVKILLQRVLSFDEFKQVKNGHRRMRRFYSALVALAAMLFCVLAGHYAFPPREASRNGTVLLATLNIQERKNRSEPPMSVAQNAEGHYTVAGDSYSLVITSPRTGRYTVAMISRDGTRKLYPESEDDGAEISQDQALQLGPFQAPSEITLVTVVVTQASATPLVRTILSKSPKQERSREAILAALEQGLWDAGHKWAALQSIVLAVPEAKREGRSPSDRSVD
jgi:hypothetical protein